MIVSYMGVLSIITLLLILLAVYLAYFRADEGLIEELVLEYYQIDKTQFSEVIVRKPTFNEMLRYKIPGLEIFVTSANSWWFVKDEGKRYFRVLETTDHSDNESIIFFEICIRKNKLLELDEFESFNI